MQRCLHFTLGSHNLPVVAGRVAASRGLTEYARTVVALLLLMHYTWVMNAQFFSHLGHNMYVCKYVCMYVCLIVLGTN